MQRGLILVSFWLFMAIAMSTRADDARRVIHDSFDHLRIDGPREWSEFPERADSAELDIAFESNRNEREWTLRIRQQDVKQTWNVLLNGKPLGSLVRDENDMVVSLSVPTDAVIAGENRLQIKQKTQRELTSDDIRVGQLELISQPLANVLSESTLHIEVKSADTGRHLPSRITIVDSNGSLQMTGAASNDHLAVRPGIVYTSTGKAQINLPAGTYNVYAGRGFEYSLGSAEVTLIKGERRQKSFTIHREVPTPGFVACDTHVHTLTHSGHGDASVEERMISLAAEGIELPIATDHNQHVDHEPFARKMNVRQFFTPVIGNEVTTNVGHFNVFPIQPEARVANHKFEDWDSILNEAYETPGVQIAILNHARDIHSGVRPFGPKRFNAVTGENLDNWGIRFNAMEVINSSATQTDPFQLFHDWMALLNRGYQITPIGSSDSHDVGRHFVGQGRTYIRCQDRDPSNINVAEAVKHLIQGRVMVSYGLLAGIRINSTYSSGELASITGDQVQVAVSVAGPHWVRATEVRLYSNGNQIRVAQVIDNAAGNASSSKSSPIKWQCEWTLPRPKHDIHLVAIATGPGIEQAYWKTAKPYQPQSPNWASRVIGCSGAVWIDADGDGHRTSAYDYARRAFAETGGDLTELIKLLASYDQAVASQAAHLYRSSGQSFLTSASTELIDSASEEAKTGIRRYIKAWRENQIARASQ